MGTKVLGLDLSIAMTGLALPSGQLARFHSRGKGDDRLADIEACLDYYIGLSAPAVAVIEKVPPSMRGGTITILRLGLVHGVARLVLAKRKVPFAYVPVTTLKKYATGSGAADKHRMVDAARDLGYEPTDDNEADAAFLRAAGVHHYDRTPPSNAHALSLELISGPRCGIEWPGLGGRRTVTRRGR